MGKLPSAEFIKSIGFDNLVLLLKDKKVISAAKVCLQRIHLLATYRHGSPPHIKEPESVNVRVFLAAFMIVYFPSRVFESVGPLEQRLLDAADPMLTAFHAICISIQSSQTRCFRDVPVVLTKDFPTLLLDYLQAFKAWKVPDEAKLTCRIKHALQALYQARRALPADEPHDSKLQVELRGQIERLRGKLVQIAGRGALEEVER
eukprot:CAMPEP_0113719680 /NCGR_PEP_ID=MMETSP0038_2-20120614/35982_1 /TAXON_ID=2898 /ORGANISM="Cryptomonas paramecium" /LENGTH=203 /DNA_ID=CAMNT_0000648145 /DNA_START=135 /DNA_END=742 /DNA_ORIENTATION=+ /assembly_acc=CAM_ASM_000170